MLHRLGYVGGYHCELRGRKKGKGAGVTVWSLGCCCGEDRGQDQTHQLISTRLGFELDYRRINIRVRVVTY